MKKRDDIIAQQYLEVCSQSNGSWNVELVIETMTPTTYLGSDMMRHCLGNFSTMEEGDKWANVMRFYYDKSIFSYELM